jgi:hypothetical protein
MDMAAAAAEWRRVLWAATEHGDIAAENLRPGLDTNMSRACMCLAAKDRRIGRSSIHP